MRAACFAITLLLAMGSHGRAQQIEQTDAALIARTSAAVIGIGKSQHAGIVSCRAAEGGQELIAAVPAHELFLLAVSQPGDASGKISWLSSRQAEHFAWSVTDNRLVLEYEHVGGRDIAVTCTVAALADRTRWHIRVTGREPVVIERLVYPILDLRTDLENDAFVAGLTKGGVFHRPSAWRQGATLNGDQPGRLCAQFACWYVPAGGLYTASRDSLGYPKTVQIQRTGDALRIAWHRRAFHPLSEAGPLELGYEVDVTTFGSQAAGEPADWRDAADIYKRWALEQPWCQTRYDQRTDVPAWLRAGPAMIRFNRDWLSDPERIEVWLNDYWRVHYPDVPLIAALWGWEHVGSWISPKYFPPFPSEEGFAQVVQAIRAANGHAFPWPSGYYWNVEFDKQPDGTFRWEDWTDFRATGAPHALLQRDGTPLVRRLPWLRGGRNAVLCRGDGWSRQWFTDNCLELMRRGCDMVQVDQVVGAAAPGNGECFATNHDHPPGPGVWDMAAFRDQLIQLARQCREVQPEAVLSIEEPQEWCNHLIAIQDYRDTQVAWQPAMDGHEPASVFGYLYHEFLPVFQSNPRAGHTRSLAHCLVTGQIPHFVPHWPVKPSPLLRNGSFTDWTGNLPTDWEKVSGWQGHVYGGSATRDDAHSADGGPCLQLENRDSAEVVQVSQNLPIAPLGLVPGRTYRLSGKTRVETLERADGGLQIAALTNKLQSRGSWRLAYSTSNSWQDHQVEFTIPPGADFLRLMIHVTGRCRLWVDDLQLREQTPNGWQPMMLSGLPPEHTLLKQWIALFHGPGRPYLLAGQMIHPPRVLEVTGGSRDLRPDLLVNAFRATDGTEAAILVNAASTTAEVRYRWRGKVRQAVLEPYGVKLVRGGN